MIGKINVVNSKVSALGETDMHFLKRVYQVVLIPILIGLLILAVSLSGCNDDYWKICNDQCVMLGSQVGPTFDTPCSDNIAYMSHAHVEDVPVEGYWAWLESHGFVFETVLPEIQDFTSTIPMHKPLYPEVRVLDGSVVSEDIEFSLNPVNSIASVVLYVRAFQTTQDALAAETFHLVPIDVTDTQYNLVTSRRKVEWMLSDNGNGFNKTFPGTDLPPQPVDNISFVTSFNYFAAGGTPSPKITFVTYRFDVRYAAGSDPLTESMEITFALQDYHDPAHSLQIPAPVYVQGDMDQLVDILFIPANDTEVTTANTEAFQREFRQKIGPLIVNSFFYEPSIRFWRSRFNFWINKDHGEARVCDECCHGLPANSALIPPAIEAKALLHKTFQNDFYDPCTEMFSAEMAPDGPHRSSFLHELGHGAFGLSDEYLNGTHLEEYQHLPNNWESRERAESAAVLRHKTSADVRKIH